LRDGELCDVAPTVLALLGLDASIEMTGKKLVQIP
jgi:bisphosphoglycerate-independent phosphoglycerate mutase (AlkP superfamily)